MLPYAFVLHIIKTICLVLSAEGAKELSRLDITRKAAIHPLLSVAFRKPTSPLL